MACYLSDQWENVIIFSAMPLKFNYKALNLSVPCMIFFPQVLEPLTEDILAYMDKWEDNTKVEVTVPSMTMVLSPATVRLILASIHSLDLHKVRT